MLSVSKKDMQAIERYAIEELGVSDIALMENAACKVIKNIDLDMRETFAIICGNGNNGGDGLVIARNLLSMGKKVDLYILGNPEEGTELFKANLGIMTKLSRNLSLNRLETLGDLEDFELNLNRVNTIIDAMVGIGCQGGLRGTAEYIADMINKSRIYTISVDMPSGMDADTGETGISCVIPNKVVTFQYMKKGLEKSKLMRNVEIIVENIGIPLEAERKVLKERPFL